MELTLSIRGTPEEIRGVLHAIERIDEGDSTGVVTDRQLQHFVRRSSWPMLAALNVIASHSTNGEAVSRTALIEQAAISGDDSLNGVLGSIGRAWSASVSGENPFLGVTTPEGTIEYRIDQELAERLLAVLARWQSHGGGRRRGGRGRPRWE